MKSTLPLLPLFSITLCTASPSIPLYTDISLVPHHTLFLRQVSDLQTYEGSLGGVKAGPITASGNPKAPFAAAGATFADFGAASQRTCDVQFNSCQEVANKAGDKGAVTVNGCGEQRTACYAAQNNAPVKSFSSMVSSMNIGPDPQFPDYDLICDA